MIELHIASLWVGGIFGFVIGIAIAFFATWWVESEFYHSKIDRFSDGWDAGIKYHEALENATKHTKDKA